ncbi:MAG: integrase core domain-containing protein, partial [Nitrososphaeraceae archaeon]
MTFKDLRKIVATNKSQAQRDLQQEVTSFACMVWNNPQLQGKIEAYNKIVKNEFLALEDIPNIDDGKLRYDMFVKAYNEAREHGGINGLTPSEMFLQRLITSAINKG